MSGGAGVSDEGGGGWALSSGPLAGDVGDGERLSSLTVGNAAGTVGDGSSGGLLGEEFALDSMGDTLDAGFVVADSAFVVFGGAGRGIDGGGAALPAVGAI